MKLRYDDEKHAYWIDGKRCKGVSTLAKTLESTYALEAWQMRMVAIGMAKTPALVEAVAVNFDDKDKMRELVDKAKAAAGSFVAQDRGTTLHRVTERHDLGLALIDTDTNTRIRDAWKAALDRAGLEVVTDWVERIVVYPSLKIAGRFDRYLRRVSDGQLFVADTKSGQKAVQYPHPIAIQLAFYANAPLIAQPLNGTSGETDQFEPNPGVDTQVGYTIHMPTDDYAEIVEFDIAAGWDTIQTILLPTLKWRDRKDLVRVTVPTMTDLLEQSCAATTVKPAAAADTPPPNTSQTTPTGPTATATLLDQTDSTFTGTHSTTTPGPSILATTATTKTDVPSTTGLDALPLTTADSTTPTEDQLKTRLREIHQHQPDLAHTIGRRWPPGVPAIRDDWDRQDVAYVAALLDEVDTEGPMSEDIVAQIVAERVYDLLPEQQARVKQWVVEAASDPTRYRPLALGAGNHTTRRIALAETCLLIAGNEVSDVSFLNGIHAAYGGPVPPIIGHALGQLNWHQAQHLLTLTRLHLNLSATIESDQP